MAKKFLILFFIMFPVAGLALIPNPPTTAELKTKIISAFRYYKNISPNITKTSVVEVPFNQESFSIPVFAVYNVTTSLFEPNLLSVNVSETRADVSVGGAANGSSLMNGGNFEI